MVDTEKVKELFVLSVHVILIISVAIIIERLKSNLESGKSSTNYEEYIANLKKMIAEYDEIKGNKKIHSNQHMLESTKSLDEKSCFDLRRFEEDNAKLKKMIVVKDEIIDSIQNKKIHPIPNHHMLESIKSMNEKSGFDLRSYEEDNAKLKKMNVEKEEIIDSKQKIHPYQEWIPALKIHFMTFISNLKPHFDFLTSKTSEAYHFSTNTLTTIVGKLQSLSINTFVTFVEKLQRSTTQFIEELYKSVRAYIMKIGMQLLSELVKEINAFYQFCLEAVRLEAARR